MKNLKRVLSLALTGVMLVGMMAIGASAVDTKDFTDKDEIQHTEAVDVMSTLGVLKGKDTGAFDPNGTVTRAEMAKIITVMLNGGNDPTLGSASSAMFSDIANHWARPYIEYCASMNIIAGMGDGTFGPDLPVTGAAAAKMLLVAMGYESSIFEFTGVDWEINVNRRANEAKLYEEIKGIDTSTGLSRDNTAQMAYNALEAKIMKTSYDRVVSTGEISWRYELSENTFLNEYFGAHTFVGSFVGNYNTGAANNKGYIAVKGRLDTDPATVIEDGETVEYFRATAKFPYDFDIDYIGEEVKVIFKDGKSSNGNQPDKNDTIYGVFVTGRTEVIRATKGDVKHNYSDKAQINIDGTKYDTEDSVNVITNYQTKSPTPKDATNGKEDNTDTKGVDESDDSALTEALMQTNGDTIKAVVSPETGKITTVYVTEYKIGAVTAKNAERVTISNVGGIEFEGNDIYEGIAKDDIVVVTTLYDTDVEGDNAYTIVEKAEVVSGTVNSYKTSKNKDDTVKTYDNVNVGGTTYTIEKRPSNAKGELLINGVNDSNKIVHFDDPNLGEDFDLYLINGYVGAAIQTSESASNYSVVTAIKGGATSGKVFNNLQLQVMDAEGTKTIITVNKDSVDGTVDKTADDYTKGDEIAKEAGDYTLGDIVVWSGSASDAKVTIKAHPVTDSKKTYKDTTKAFDGAVTTSGCVLFAETSAKSVKDDVTDGEIAGASFKTYSIRSLRELDSTYTTVVENSEGKAVAVFMDLTKVPGGATGTTIYGIVTAVVGRGNASDGSPYNRYTVVSNNDSYTVNIDSYVAIAVGDLVSLQPTADEIYGDDDVTVYIDGYADDEADIYAGAAYVKEYDEADKIITVYGEVEKKGAAYEGKGEKVTLALDDSCVVVYVNADDDKGGAEIGINPFDSVTGWKNVALVTTTDNGEDVVIAIFVETSNKCDILETPCEHAELETVPAKAGDDCQTKGNAEYKKCKECGKLFDTDGTTELDKIPEGAYGEHDYAPAPVKDDAKQHIDTCTVCGDTTGKTAENHTFALKDGKHVCACGAEHAAEYASEDPDAACAKATETGCAVTKPNV